MQDVAIAMIEGLIQKQQSSRSAHARVPTGEVPEESFLVLVETLLKGAIPEVPVDLVGAPPSGGTEMLLTGHDLGSGQLLGDDAPLAGISSQACDLMGSLKQDEMKKGVARELLQGDILMHHMGDNSKEVLQEARGMTQVSRWLRPAPVPTAGEGSPDLVQQDDHSQSNTNLLVQLGRSKGVLPQEGAKLPDMAPPGEATGTSQLPRVHSASDSFQGRQVQSGEPDSMVFASRFEGLNAETGTGLRQVLQAEGAPDGGEETGRSGTQEPFQISPLRIFRRLDDTGVRLRLVTGNLGQLNLEVVSSREGVQASLTSSDPGSRRVLLGELGALRTALQEAGLNLKQLEVREPAYSNMGPGDQEAQQFREGPGGFSWRNWQRGYGGEVSLSSGTDEDSADMDQIDPWRRGFNVRA